VSPNFHTACIIFKKVSASLPPQNFRFGKGPDEIDQYQGDGLAEYEKNSRFFNSPLHFDIGFQWQFSV